LSTSVVTADVELFYNHLIVVTTMKRNNSLTKSAASAITISGFRKSRLSAGVVAAVTLSLWAAPLQRLSAAEALSVVPVASQVAAPTAVYTAVPVASPVEQQSSKQPKSAQGLTLKAFLGKLMEKNPEIKARQLEWQSNEKMVNASRALYEPMLKLSASRESNHVSNTAQEFLQRSGSSEFSERNNLFNTTVEGLTPFGGTYSVGSEIKDLRNNLQSAGATYAGYKDDNEYVTFLGVNVTQPLLKGAGQKTTTANIRLARTNADIAYEGYRQAAVETIARAVQLYWQCYGAQEKLQMRQRSATIAGEMLQQNQSRYEAGKSDYTSVLDAESGLRLRQALVAAAEQTELTATRNLLSLLGEYGASQQSGELKATDVPACPLISVDYTQSLRDAYNSYPQYLSAIKTVTLEDTRSAYAKDQQLPQLNVKGSYGMNGLAYSLGNSLSQSFSNDYLSWSLGLEFKMPLFGDNKSRNEAHAARLKKEQAEQRLTMQKVELANQMEIVAGLVSRVYNQVQNYEKVVALNAQLVQIEDSRFQMGKSDTRMMLEREEDYLKVRESLLDSRLAYQYALVNLYALDGTLLQRYGLSQQEKVDR